MVIRRLGIGRRWYLLDWLGIGRRWYLLDWLGIGCRCLLDGRLGIGDWLGIGGPGPAVKALPTPQQEGVASATATWFREGLHCAILLTVSFCLFVGSFVLACLLLIGLVCWLVCCLDMATGA